MNDCRRASLRLQGHNYTTPRWYFVTLCTQGMKQIMGSVICSTVYLSDYGHTVNLYWLSLEARYSNLYLGEYVIMPNHIHSVVCIERADKNLSDIVGEFKSLSASAYIRGTKNGIYPSLEHNVWQRGFHNRIVRSTKDRLRIVQYINNNPTKWFSDRYFVDEP